MGGHSPWQGKRPKITTCHDVQLRACRARRDREGLSAGSCPRIAPRQLRSILVAVLVVHGIGPAGENAWPSTSHHIAKHYPNCAARTFCQTHANDLQGLQRSHTCSLQDLPGPLTLFSEHLDCCVKQPPHQLTASIRSCACVPIGRRQDTSMLCAGAPSNSTDGTGAAWLFPHAGGAH